MKKKFDQNGFHRSRFRLRKRENSRQVYKYITYIYSEYDEEKNKIIHNIHIFKTLYYNTDRSTDIPAYNV